MRSGSLIFPLVFVYLLGGCAGRLYSKPEPLQPVPPQQDLVKQAPPGPDLVRTEDYVIVIAQPGDTLRSLAKRFLGDVRIGDSKAILGHIAGPSEAQPLKTPLVRASVPSTPRLVAKAARRKAGHGFARSGYAGQDGVR